MKEENRWLLTYRFDFIKLFAFLKNEIKRGNKLKFILYDDGDFAIGESYHEYNNNEWLNESDILFSYYFICLNNSGNVILRKYQFLSIRNEFFQTSLGTSIENIEQLHEIIIKYIKPCIGKQYGLSPLPSIKTFYKRKGFYYY